MSGTPVLPPRQLFARVTWATLAVLLLTSAHHVYGAYLYHTPWRVHVAYVSAATAAVIAASLLIIRSHPHDAAGRIAFWLFASVTIALPIVGIGLFEGAYNHVLKDALYVGGASPALMHRLFPPPAYELPNDALFEISGVLQVLPAAVSGWYLYRLLRSRPAGSTMAASA